MVDRTNEFFSLINESNVSRKSQTKQKPPSEFLTNSIRINKTLLITKNRIKNALTRKKIKMYF